MSHHDGDEAEEGGTEKEGDGEKMRDRDRPEAEEGELELISKYGKEEL